jgi:large subunit ribosomal protein L2
VGIKNFKPITPSRRQYSVPDFAEITRDYPEKSLLSKLSRSGGRNNTGRVTDINMGGGHKRSYRVIDFKRDKIGVPGTVASIEYDPNRSARIALVHFHDGEKRYVVAPIGLGVGQTVMNSPEAEIRPGNALPLKNIPTGQSIFSIELKPGKGAQLVRSGGTTAQLVAKEGDYALVKLPSGELRKVLAECYAVIGVVSNPDHQNIEIGKAGRSRWMHRRPHNRGVTKNPVDHPMGGGEGKTSGGRHPVSRTGVLAKGLKTRRNKRTNKFIVRRRGGGKAE